MVGVPVYEAVKRMTESHSAVLLSGMDRNAVVEQLRNAFTNLDADGAVVSERKIKDLIKDLTKRWPSLPDRMLSALKNEDQYGLWWHDEEIPPKTGGSPVTESQPTE